MSVVLDVGTDNESLLSDELYVVRHFFIFLVFSVAQTWL